MYAGPTSFRGTKKVLRKSTKYIYKKMTFVILKNKTKNNHFPTYIINLKNFHVFFLLRINFSEVYRDYCHPFFKVLYQHVFIGHLKSSDNYNSNTTL